MKALRGMNKEDVVKPMHEILKGTNKADAALELVDGKSKADIGPCEVVIEADCQFTKASI